MARLEYSSKLNYTDEEDQANQKKDAAVFIAAFTERVRHRVHQERMHHLMHYTQTGDLMTPEEFKREVDDQVKWYLSEYAEKLVDVLGAIS